MPQTRVKKESTAAPEIHDEISQLATIVRSPTTRQNPARASRGSKRKIDDYKEYGFDQELLTDDDQYAESDGFAQPARQPRKKAPAKGQKGNIAEGTRTFDRSTSKCKESFGNTETKTAVFDSSGNPVLFQLFGTYELCGTLQYNTKYEKVVIYRRNLINVPECHFKFQTTSTSSDGKLYVKSGPRGALKPVKSLWMDIWGRPVGETIRLNDNCQPINDDNELLSSAMLEQFTDSRREHLRDPPRLPVLPYVPNSMDSDDVASQLQEANQFSASTGEAIVGAGMCKWSRVLFRFGTADNGPRRKGQSYKQIVLSLMAKLGDGKVLSLVECPSREVIVNARSPKGTTNNELEYYIDTLPKDGQRPEPMKPTGRSGKKRAKKCEDESELDGSTLPVAAPEASIEQPARQSKRRRKLPPVEETSAEGTRVLPIPGGASPVALSGDTPYIEPPTKDVDEHGANNCTGLQLDELDEKLGQEHVADQAAYAASTEHEWVTDGPAYYPTPGPTHRPSLVNSPMLICTVKRETEGFDNTASAMSRNFEQQGEDYMALNDVYEEGPLDLLAGNHNGTALASERGPSHDGETIGLGFAGAELAPAEALGEDQSSWSIVDHDGDVITPWEPESWRPAVDSVLGEGDDFFSQLADDEEMHSLAVFLS